MKRIIFSLLLISAPVCFPSNLLGQATPTLTPDCCQYAQTLTGGSGGNFNIVNHLAVNSMGTTLYVADSLNNQIQKFSMPGLIPAGVIGSLPEPAALVMGADGFLYVGEYGSSQINKIDPASGSITATMLTTGPVLGIEVDSNGDVYASLEVATNNVLIYPYTAPNSYGTPVSINFPQIIAPRGIVKRGSKLFVADHNQSQILELDQSGPATAFNFGVPQTVVDVSLISYPSQIEMDSLNHLYVTSGGNGYMAVFNGDLSSTPGVFTLHHQCINGSMVPQGVAVDNMGTVYEGANDVSGTGPWDVFKINICPSFGFTTPTPSYGGVNPPESGNPFIYPSPAKGNQATLSYKMAESGKVVLNLWNQNGELSARITDQKGPGVQITTFDISRFSSGVYFYSVTLNYDSGKVERSKTKKFAVVH